MDKCDGIRIFFGVGTKWTLEMRSPELIDGAVVAVFGGSFDPVTFAHLQIAAEVLSFGLASQIWMVPCGMRPDKHTVVTPQMRLEMLSLAIDDIFPRSVPIFTDSMEVDADRYIPTRELMNMYRAKYPSMKFKVLMGDDLLTSLHLWDDFHELVSENSFIVYPRTSSVPIHAPARPDTGTSLVLNDQDGTLLHIERLSNELDFQPVFSSASSTEIRRRIQSSNNGSKAIMGLTPWTVIKYIQQHSLYS